MKLSFKVFIANLLTSSFIGKFIKIVTAGILKKDGIKVNLKSSEITPKTIALIAWGFYESAERRLIKAYLRSDLPVIELGTSLGIVACMSRQINKQKLVCVEANQGLIPLIHENFKLNKIENFEIINAAIGNEDEALYFEKGSSNTLGRVINYKTSSSIVIEKIKLSTILSTRNIKDYILICDIEGAEIFILKNDSHALINCKQIIIETHEVKIAGTLINPAEMRNRITEMGFFIKAQSGPNYVFEKN